jgi:hypothetical protein
VGPRDLDVAVSVNGGGFTGIASVEDFAYLTPQLQTVDLSALTNVTSATFRIFPHQSFDFGGVPGTDRYFQLINSGSIAGSRSIVVNGVAVPEPSAFLFGLLVCAVTGTGYYFRSVRSSGEKS